MNLRLIDPNKSKNGSIPQPEDLCIDVQLVAHQKNNSSIVAEGRSIVNTNTVGGLVDFINGQKIGKEKSLSTYFTEVGSVFDKTTLGKDGKRLDLETLGIKSIDIDFDTSNIPLIKMNLIDVRGRLFEEGNESPYSIYFDFPYPLFSLKIKGYFGKTVSYDLHLVNFKSKFNSSYGGFDITCEFIGYTYAYLSDLLIGYLRGVSYTNAAQNLTNENYVSFIEFHKQVNQMINVAKDYRDTGSQNTVENQQIEINNLIKLKEDITNALTTFHQTKNSSGSVVNNTNFKVYDDKKFVLLPYSKDSIDNENKVLNIVNTINSLIENYNNSNEISVSKIENKDFSVGVTFNYTNNWSEPYKDGFDDEGVRDSDAIRRMITQHKEISGDVLYFNVINLSIINTEITEWLAEKRQNIKTERETAIAGFESLLSTNSVDTSIGNYFKLLCDNADLLVKAIKNVATLAETSPTRKNQFVSLEGVGNDNVANNDTIKPFPEYYVKNPDGSYVDGWIGDIVGSEPIPEVEFVEELIQGIVKARQELNDLEANLAFEQKPELGQVLDYIPLNVMDHPIGGATLGNPYKTLNQTNDLSEFIDILSDRVIAFLLTTTNWVTKGVNFYDSDFFDIYGAIESFNMRKILNENTTLNDTIKFKLGNISSNNVVKFNGIDLDFSGSNGVNDITLLVINNILGKVSSSKNATTPFISENIYNPKGNHLLPISVNFRTGAEIPLHFYFYDSNGVKQSNYDLTNAPSDYFSRSRMVIGDSNIISNYRLPENNINFNQMDDPTFAKDYIKPNSKTGFQYQDRKGGANASYLLGGFSNEKILAYKTSSGNQYITNFSNNKTIKNTTESGFKSIRIGLSINGSEGSVDTNKVFSDISTRQFLNSPGENYISDILVNIYGKKVQSLWATSIFHGQETSEARALVFLSALPLDNVRVTYTSGDLYFGDFTDVFTTSGGVRAPYLAIALIGGWFKQQKGLTKIRVKGNDGSGYYPIFNESHSDANGYLKTDLLLMSTNTNVKNTEVRLSLSEGSLRSKSSGIWRIDDTTKLEFIKIFDDFVSLYTANIDDDARIFVNDGPNNVKLNHQTISDCLAIISDRNWSSYPRLNKTKMKMFDVIGGDASSVISSHGNVFFRMGKTNPISTKLHELMRKETIVINAYSEIIGFGIEKEFPIGEGNYVIGKRLVSFLGSVLSNLNANTVSTIETQSNSMQQIRTSFGLNESDDIRIKVYKDIKSIYDKWIIGSDITEKSLFSYFKFINRTYDDISGEFKINPLAMTRDLMANLHQPLYSHISKVLGENNFNFLPTPNYLDLHDSNEMRDLFKPFRWDAQSKSIGPMFICMYVGEFSNKLDLGKDNAFRSDGINLTLDDNRNEPIITYISAPDFSGDKEIPIIRVRFGDQNQSIFTDFEVDQSEYSLTNEALVITDNLSKGSNVSQNLYDIYVNRSYTLNLTLLGNAMIQPFMYIYLENVPMFYGLYFITKVSHSINENTMMSKIKAVRMRNTMTKLIDDETLYYSLYNELKDTQYIGSGSKITSGEGTLSQNIIYPIESSETIGIKMRNDGKEKNFVLPETKSFIIDLGQRWASWVKTQPRPIQPYINFTGASYKYGGYAPGHESHKQGVELDIRFIMQNPFEDKDSKSGSGPLNDNPRYDKEATRNLLRIIKTMSKEPKYANLVSGKDSLVNCILFNDSSLINEGLSTFYKGHYDHIHVALHVPDTYKNGISLGSEKTNGVAGSVVGKYTKLDVPSGTAGNYGDLTTRKIKEETFQLALSEAGKINLPNSNPYIKGFMDALSFSEGTSCQTENGGYDVVISDGKKGRTISNWTPNTNTAHGGSRWKTISSASGRYQFVYDTWVEYNGDVNKPMTKTNQDIAGYNLVIYWLKRAGNIDLKEAYENRKVFDNLCSSILGVKGWESLHKTKSGHSTINLNRDLVYDLFKKSVNIYLTK